MGCHRRSFPNCGVGLHYSDPPPRGRLFGLKQCGTALLHIYIDPGRFFFSVLIYQAEAAARTILEAVFEETNNSGVALNVKRNRQQIISLLARFAMLAEADLRGMAARSSARSKRFRLQMPLQDRNAGANAINLQQPVEQDNPAARAAVAAAAAAAGAEARAVPPGGFDRG